MAQIDALKNTTFITQVPVASPQSMTPQKIQETESDSADERIFPDEPLQHDDDFSSNEEAIPQEPADNANFDDNVTSYDDEDDISSIADITETVESEDNISAKKKKKKKKKNKNKNTTEYTVETSEDSLHDDNDLSHLADMPNLQDIISSEQSDDDTHVIDDFDEHNDDTLVNYDEENNAVSSDDDISDHFTTDELTSDLNDDFLATGHQESDEDHVPAEKSIYDDNTYTDVLTDDKVYDNTSTDEQIYQDSPYNDFQNTPSEGFFDNTEVAESDASTTQNIDENLPAVDDNHSDADTLADIKTSLTNYGYNADSFPQNDWDWSNIDEHNDTPTNNFIDYNTTITNDTDQQPAFSADTYNTPDSNTDNVETNEDGQDWEWDYEEVPEGSDDGQDWEWDYEEVPADDDKDNK